MNNICSSQNLNIGGLHFACFGTFENGEVFDDNHQHEKNFAGGDFRMRFCDIGRLASRWMVVTVVILAGCELKTTPNNPTASTSLGETATKSVSPSNAESETISAEGSSTVYPIAQTFAVEFERNSKHKVSVGRQGTGGGYKKFVNRQADIWNASRGIDEKEIEELKSKGIEWLELTIAVDGIVIVVNPQNTWCTEITCGQLKRMWEPDSQVKTWKDLNADWPAEPIQLYGADTDSGTFEYFTEVINGKKKASNFQYTPASDDNILVTGVASNKFSLGYIPYGYYVENTEKLKVLNVSPSTSETAGAEPAVVPTDDSILSGEYKPLSRPLFMYASRSSLQARHEVVDFLTYALSDQAQPLIRKRGFVPVRDDVRQVMQKRLSEAAPHTKTEGK